MPNIPDFDLPIITPSVDRWPDGRLKPGAKIGKGNPLAQQQYEYRRAWLDATTEEESLQVRSKLVERALEGDLVAIKLYVDITHGKQPLPIEFSSPDGESIKVEAANTVAVILGALSSHPEAKIAVAAALSGRVVPMEGSSHGLGNGNDAAV
jgi:hypothetical protein